MHVALLLIALVAPPKVPEWLEHWFSESAGYARGEHGWVSWHVANVVEPRIDQLFLLGPLRSHGQCGGFAIWSSRFLVLAQRRNEWQLVDPLSTERVESHHAIRCVDGVVAVEVRIERDRRSDPFDTGWPTPTRFVLHDPRTQLHADVSWTQSADQPGPVDTVIRDLLAETRVVLSRVRRRSGFSAQIEKLYGMRGAIN